MPVLKLATPVSELSGVGAALSGRLRKLGIRQVRDLLFHLPYRYVDRTRVTAMGSLVPGQEVLVQGIIELSQVRYPGRRSLLCHVSDGTGALILRFFHFNRSQELGLKRGAVIRCWGEVRRGTGGPEMIHPEYEVYASGEPAPLEETLTPVYPATEGLGQGRLRKLNQQALRALDSDPAGLREFIPDRLLRNMRLPTLEEAIRFVHRPPPGSDTGKLLEGVHPCQRRLAFEELLAYHLSLRSLRNRVRRYAAIPLVPRDDRLTRNFRSRLPFRLTAAQERVAAEVLSDMRENTPMMRLLQGDVGSGKTVIAALAAVQAVGAGFQVAFMAPTELLADQHAFTIGQWLSGLPIPVIPLSARTRAATARAHLSTIAGDQPLIAVGTHALLQERVAFGRLGLAIIDEQHRFGVEQRLALLEKGSGDGKFPHQLIMTATPIPRTLAMTLFADLDVSVIDELPPGRQVVRTVVVSGSRRNEVIERVETACRAGRQVYWVCPLIEESESLQCEAAIRTRDALATRFPQLRIGLVHGRMPAREKDAAMQAFKAGESDILVATTVIEVGVDVPRASLMVIENAERLGLAQLHQLRGRVGRGRARSDCVLLYQPPLSAAARTRLATLRRTSDGFAIAEQDLKLRGPGEFLGTRQTGLQNLRVARLERDARLIPQVQKIAATLVADYPESVEPLIHRWIAAEADVSAV